MLLLSLRQHLRRSADRAQADDRLVDKNDLLRRDLERASTTTLAAIQREIRPRTALDVWPGVEPLSVSKGAWVLKSSGASRRPIHELKSAAVSRR